MDREKVINGLKACLESDSCGKCQYREYAMDCSWHLKYEALMLLKSQEPSDDWISRKRLKDEIQYYIDEAGWGEEINKALGWCLEFIDNQGAVKWE